MVTNGEYPEDRSSLALPLFRSSGSADEQQRSLPPHTHQNTVESDGSETANGSAMTRLDNHYVLIPASADAPIGLKSTSSTPPISDEYLRACDDLNSLAEGIFSDIRSESTGTLKSVLNEAEEYEHCGPLKRAFPERSFALIVTLIFELPTLFLISGGSDRLCILIGRKKYTTLIALLPIASAISGNVGLQASTLTTRAISHAQVRVDNYAKWLGKEVLAALCLGIAVGVVTATIAYCMGGFSFPFALSIFTAQFIGILTAGCTGTLAPLLFTFIFKRDSGKWGGPLETAVQDVVGSFSMIVITYHIMLLFGPFELEPSDMCYAEQPHAS